MRGLNKQSAIKSSRRSERKRRKKYVFDYFEAFFIVFDHANAYASMHLLVEIHNTSAVRLGLASVKEKPKFILLDPL